MNLLVEEIGRWLHREVLEVKYQSTAELVWSIEGQEDDDALELENSSKGEEENDSENDSVKFLRCV